METKSTKKIGKSTIVYSMASVLLFIILFGAVYYGTLGGREKSEVSIVMLGDSILGQHRDNTSISVVLADMLGVNIINGGLGGTCMGRTDKEMRLANTKDCLSMQALGRAIVTDDFGAQQTVRIRENATEYFESTINSLEQIDYESVDILFIGHGLNDYHAGMQIYNPEDPRDVYTFTGALRSTLEMLQKAYPDMRIILLTPTYSWYILDEELQKTCENSDFGGGTLEDYVNAELELARDMGVEVIDLYHDFYPHESWDDWMLCTWDGVHPNEESRFLIAEKIYNYLTR